MAGGLSCPLGQPTTPDMHIFLLQSLLSSQITLLPTTATVHRLCSPAEPTSIPGPWQMCREDQEPPQAQTLPELHFPMCCVGLDPPAPDRSTRRCPGAHRALPAAQPPGTNGITKQAAPACYLTSLSFFNTHTHTHTCPNESSLEWLAGPQLYQLPAQPLQHCWEWETLEMNKDHAWEKPCTPPPLLAASSTDRLELNGVTSIK